MQIGPYQLPHNLLLAPMAGVTDRPFRQICSQFEVGLTISEMVITNNDLLQHPKTLQKTDFNGIDLRSVQIFGAEPEEMARAAQINQDRGAHIIDINMGCPAKKVCATAAGSALLKDEALVARILYAVVNAVEVPVTLKIRTGWDLAHRNAVSIAKIAEDTGIAALTIHGRSRACKFAGSVEYETIKQVKQSVKIPIIANGDINSAEKAREVLNYTDADAIMIGRGALGRPWIFNEFNRKLNGAAYTSPSVLEIKNIIHQHLESLYSFYGSHRGVKIARKHIGWYFNHLGGIPVSLKTAVNQVLEPAQQLALVNASFNYVTSRGA